MTEVQKSIQTSAKVEIPSAKLKDIHITDYIRESLDKVAKTEGFTNYELLVDHGSSIGDGFVGIMIKVKIQEIDSKKFLHVLAKVPPESKTTREFMKLMAFFEREVYIYNNFLPLIIEFQNEMKIKWTEGFFNFPKVFYADYDKEKDDAIIIMEDLRNFGYKMWDKSKPVNFEHSKLLMVTLGKLHALSFAMKIKKPEIFEKFKELNDYVSQNFKEGQHKDYFIESMKKAIESLSPSDKESKQKFQNLADNFIEVLMDVTTANLIEPFGVVGHGDCWINNYLFHYESDQTPDRIVLVDWQVSRYSSPVADLLYFIFVCTDHTLRAKHYEELLKAYHDSLKELLHKLGGNIELQFPFSAFEIHLKRFGKMGAVLASFMIQILLTKKEDLPDLEFVAAKMEKDEIVGGLLDSFCRQPDLFNARMRDVIHDVINYGYL